MSCSQERQRTDGQTDGRTIRNIMYPGSLNVEGWRNLQRGRRYQETSQLISQLANHRTQLSAVTSSHSIACYDATDKRENLEEWLSTAHSDGRQRHRVNTVVLPSSSSTTAAFTVFILYRVDQQLNGVNADCFVVVKHVLENFDNFWQFIYALWEA